MINKIMYGASAKFIEEYEKCVKDWIKNNKHKHKTSFATCINIPCKEIDEK